MVRKRPALSVVLPCFNGADVIGKCLESLQRQTFNDFEVIVFDDGSTDGSADAVRRFSRRDRRIRLLKSPHIGLVEALRQACAAAAAPLIARIDCDDTAHPKRLERQAAYLRGHRATALCGTRIRSVGTGLALGRVRYANWVNGLVTHNAIVRDLFVECPIPHPTFMMRRTAYEAVGGYQDLGWAEDYDLLLRLHLAGHVLGKVDATLLDWRHSPDRLSQTDPRYSRENFRALKRHYLFKSHLSGGRPFHQWGAGEVGKAWLKEWGEAKPAAVVDINPRKVGRSIHGVRVIPPSALPPPGACFVVAAVGAPGARAEIRQWFRAGGYLELRDYVFLA